MPDSFKLWSWWFFSAVVMGIVINLTSAYIKYPVDKVWEKISDSRRSKNETYRQKIAEAVEKLIEDPNRLVRLDIILNRHYIHTYSLALIIILFQLYSGMLIDSVITEFAYKA